MRRLGLALAIALAGAGVARPAQAAHDSVAAVSPQRAALLARAQSELERGDAAAALDDFERAAMMLHAPDAELGLIRAAMQDGQYRRALAFCAHTAGEHTDEPDGAVLYAWLLRVGGQAALADRQLAQAGVLLPGDPLIDAATAAFAAAAPRATGMLREPLNRMAPWPTGEPPVPAGVRVLGGAVLLGDGAIAAAPASLLALPAGARLWVRNGLGQAVRVTSSGQHDTDADVALLTLSRPLSPGASVQRAGRPPFAGSPAYVLQFAPAETDAAWPWMTLGFLGAAPSHAGHSRLGVDAVVPASAGAAVLDAQGRLAGITLARGEWASLGGGAVAAADDRPATARVAPDEAYERGLRRALQLLTDAPAP